MEYCSRDKSSRNCLGGFPNYRLIRKGNRWSIECPEIGEEVQVGCLDQPKAEVPKTDQPKSRSSKTSPGVRLEPEEESERPEAPNSVQGTEEGTSSGRSIDESSGTDDSSAYTPFKIEQPGTSSTGEVHEPIMPPPEVWETANLPEPAIPDGVPEWFFRLRYTYKSSRYYAIFNKEGHFIKFVDNWNAAQAELRRHPDGCAVRYDPQSGRCTVYGGVNVGFSSAGQGEFQAQVNQFNRACDAYEEFLQNKHDAMESIQAYRAQKEAYEEYQSKLRNSLASDEGGSSDTDSEEEDLNRGDGSVPDSEPERGGLYDDGSNETPANTGSTDTYSGGWGGPSDTL